MLLERLHYSEILGGLDMKHAVQRGLVLDNALSFFPEKLALVSRGFETR
jgi:hypothetical protein